MTGRSSSLASSSVAPGTQLNGVYEIDSLIGIGGMGEVFKGHNIQTGDPVAIKVVLPEYAKDELILDLFRKEARILNHLAHDAIVRYYVFTIAAELGRPYLAMEYVDGPSLAEYLKTNGLLSCDDVIILQRRLADGLEKAHEAGIIHRDISPDNVILPDGRVDRAKIIDFGIARSARVGGATLLGGSFAGKYNFVSPEQLGLFGGEVTPRSDLYGLGLVLAAALRGRPIDMGGSQVEVVEKRRTVPDMSGIDSRLQPLLRAMLQPDPAFRISSMAEVRDWRLPSRTERPALEKTVVRGEVPPQRKQPSPPARVQPAPQGRAPLPRNAPPKRPSRSRGGLAFAALGVGAVAAGAFGGWWYVENQLGNWYKPPPEVSPPPKAGGTGQVASQGSGTTSGPGPVAQPSDSGGTGQAASQGSGATGGPGPVAQPSDNGGTASPGATKITEPAKPIERLPEVIKPTDVAPQPPAEPPPSQIVAGAAGLISFINGYNGGDCFFATPKSIGDHSAAIIGLGNRQEPFDHFLAAFQAKAGFDPDITLGLVSQSQCPVVNALKTLTSNPAHSTLELDRDQVPVGNLLQGTVTGIGGRDVEVVLIDHEGVVQNLRGANALTRTGDSITFKIKLRSEQQIDDKAGFLPMIILSVGSSKRIDSLASLDPTVASELMPKLLAESRQKGDITATVGYFKLVGPKG